MGARAKVLVVLGLLDVALVALIILANWAVDDLTLMDKTYQDRIGVLDTLHKQETALVEGFERRLPAVGPGADHDSMGSLYDTLGSDLLGHVPDLRVKNVSYDFNASTNYAKLTVTIPFETSPLASLERFLTRVEQLQDKYWLAVQGLTIEARQTPVEGVAGTATLVLYFVKG